MQGNSHAQEPTFDPADLAIATPAADCCGPDIAYAVRARTLYLNDQRIQFTGNESTFGVEAQLDVEARHQLGNGEVGMVGELYFTQPFNRNILADYPLRESFRHNFLIDPFEISELFVFARRGAWEVRAGKFESPFGRYWAPIQLNSRTDVPFIRSESILFRETGLLVSYSGNPMNVSIGLTNGGLDRDSNSSKALIARVGYESENFVLGGSVKWHDGIGSESQKEFNRHVGLDIMKRLGPNLRFSGEVIYDEYGLRRPGTNLDDIFWGRSIYNRQLNNGLRNPLSGVGFYANLIWDLPRDQVVVGYGEFHPRAIGDHIHDQVTRRILGKVIHRFDSHFEVFGSLIFENKVKNAQAGVDRKGTFVMFGAEYHW